MKKLTVTLMLFTAVVFIANDAGSKVKVNQQPKKDERITLKGSGGGIVFYDKGSYSDGWRYLEAATVDQGTAPWGCKGRIVGASGTAIGTGRSNTQAIANGCEEANCAAKICKAYRGGGKYDWFLPSRDELNVMYVKLKCNGKGSFAGDSYWSSSENSAASAWSQYFLYGNQNYYIKADSLRVRAVRAF